MGSGSWGFLLSLFKKQNNTAILPLVEQHIPKDAVIIDADAGAGAFTRLFAHAVPHGHVYAFEPGKALRAILSKVIAARQLHNVSLFPMGLGSAKTLESSCPVMRTEIHTTLDQFAARHGLKKVDVIRADAGEDQLQVLHGAHRTIDKHRPVLLLATNDDGNTSAEVHRFLRDFNYRVDHIENSGKKLTPLDAPSSKGTLWCVAH